MPPLTSPSKAVASTQWKAGLLILRGYLIASVLFDHRQGVQFSRPLTAVSQNGHGNDRDAAGGVCLFGKANPAAVAAS